MFCFNPEAGTEIRLKGDELEENWLWKRTEAFKKCEALSPGQGLY